MPISRRDFVRSVSVSSLVLALNLYGCGHRSASHTGNARRYVINANMVIPSNLDEPLDEATRKQLSETGLTAIKLSLGGSGGSYQQVHDVLDSVATIYPANPDFFMPINKMSDLNEAYDSGRVGIIYSFETATMLDGKVERIAEFAARGVRIMQPGYNTTNEFGAGAMSTVEPLGLSELGRESIRAMESAQVLVDLSHAHERTAIDVLAIASRPVALTHTGCFAVNPHPRNKTDAVLKATADNGGVVGIYEMSYLTPDLDQQSLTAFMAHVNHAVNVCGADHVGIGSDTPLFGFDTSPQSLAQWDAINKARQESGVAAPGEGPPPYVVGLNGPHKMPAIARELEQRGFNAATIDKIMGQNFARVFEATWPG